jgi:hypothetical protein
LLSTTDAGWRASVDNACRIAFDPFIQEPGISVQPRANQPLEWLGAPDSRQPSARKTRTVADPLFENLRGAPECKPLVIN